MTELKKMNKYKTPRDKLVMICNFIKVIGKMLWDNSPDGMDGADVVFPTIVYLIVHSNPPNLVLNVEYVATYSNDELVSDSEEEYFLTTMQSAIDFILNCKAEDLSIGRDEFEDKYTKAADIDPEDEMETMSEISESTND